MTTEAQRAVESSGIAAASALDNTYRRITWRLLPFLLGVFEAGFYPGVILFLTYWYPSERRAKVFGLFMSASALAGVIGGPLAGAIMAGGGRGDGWVRRGR